jgi:hypothetical protein
VRRFLRDNSLSLTLFALFAFSIVAQAVVGWKAYGEQLNLHKLPAVGFGAYLSSGHFISAVFENWESEFLQMAAYVLLTVFLVQKGSPESRADGEDNPEDEDPAGHQARPEAPWPVRRGGWFLTLYSHSLSLALVSLYFLPGPSAALALDEGFPLFDQVAGGFPRLLNVDMCLAGAERSVLAVALDDSVVRTKRAQQALFLAELHSAL